MFSRRIRTVLLALSLASAGGSLAACADDYHHHGWGDDRGAYWNGGDDHDRWDRDRHDWDHRDRGDDHDRGGWWWWQH